MEVWIDPVTKQIKAIYKECSTNSQVWADQDYEKYDQIHDWMLSMQPPTPTPEMPPNPTYATITDIDVNAEKPIEVQRTYNGETFTFRCYVTQDLVDLHQAGNLNIGDIVTLIFADHDLNKPLAQQKVHKTW